MGVLGGLRRSAKGRHPAPFIVGVGRSGTTLLRLMLDSHPELAIPPETHFIPELTRAFPGRRVNPDEFAARLDAHRRWGDFHLEAGEVSDRVAALRRPRVGDALRAFYELYAEHQGKARWGDKTPKYLLHMKRIQRVLPEARFIHLIRDGRDVALSKADRSGRDVEESAVIWRKRIAKARRQSARLDHYLELRYEDLVLDAEPTLRRACEFLDLEWDQGMLDYHRRAASRLEEMGDARRGAGDVRPAETRRAAHARTTAPPDPGRTARWRDEMGDADRAAFEREAGELLASLGYETAGAGRGSS